MVLYRYHTKEILLMIAILFAVGILAAPTVSSARVSVGITVAFAPPALPIYVQPFCPGPGYIWTPGYWAWDPDIGYYWVPGTWVLAPFAGALWTPGYWGWSDGLFVWYAGYWGFQVGFYGGINYGFGYTGYGYQGGYWDRGVFYYNRTVNNVNITNITNVYSKPVAGAVTTSRVSYNGGRGGTTVRPTAAQLAMVKERHTAPTSVQLQNERAARSDPGQRATVNRGKPVVAATPKPGVLTGSGVVRASRAGATYKAPPSGGKSVTHSTSVRPAHPAGGIEKSPRVEKGSRVTGPERVAPKEHHVAPMNKSTGGIERSPRVTGPERVAPKERHVAPMNKPAGPASRPSESRHLSESHSSHGAAPQGQGQGSFHAGNPKQEGEGRSH